MVTLTINVGKPIQNVHNETCYDVKAKITNMETLGVCTCSITIHANYGAFAVWPVPVYGNPNALELTIVQMDVTKD